MPGYDSASTGDKNRAAPTLELIAASRSLIRKIKRTSPEMLRGTMMARFAVRQRRGPNSHEPSRTRNNEDTLSFIRTFWTNFAAEGVATYSMSPVLEALVVLVNGPCLF